MSIQAIHAALYTTHTPDGTPLGSSAKLTLHAIAARTSDDSSTCWHSIKALMALTGLSSKTLHDALKTLEACGYISRRIKPGYYYYCTLNIEAMQAARRYQHSDYDYTTYMPQELVDDSIYL